MLLCVAFKDDLITIHHISLAISGVYNNYTASCTEELPLQQRATVATLVVLSHQKENRVTLEKVQLYICSVKLQHAYMYSMQYTWYLYDIHVYFDSYMILL